LKIPGYIREKLNIDFKFEDIPSEYFYKTCEYLEEYDKAIQVMYSPEWELRELKGIRKMFKIIVESKCKVFYGSDAHSPINLAYNLKYTEEILYKLGLKPDRIWNPILE